MIDTIWIFIAAFMTLCIYSFLYRDNPFYKFAEHLFVGISAGYYIVFYYHQSVKPNLIDHVASVWTRGASPLNLIAIIPGILGFFFILRFIPKTSWLSRWSIAFYVGAGSGLSIPRMMKARIITQIQGTMRPFFDTALWNEMSTDFSGWKLLTFLGTPLMIIGVLCTLAYFFFSMAHKGLLGKAAGIGITFLMIGFGASFGYTVMARISLLIGRTQFLIEERQESLVAFLFIVAGLILWTLLERSRGLREEV
jgi:hypothetical protein